MSRINRSSYIVFLSSEIRVSLLRIRKHFNFQVGSLNKHYSEQLNSSLSLKESISLHKTQQFVVLNNLQMSGTDRIGAYVMTMKYFTFRDCVECAVNN